MINYEQFIEELRRKLQELERFEASPDLYRNASFVEWRHGLNSLTERIRETGYAFNHSTKRRKFGNEGRVGQVVTGEAERCREDIQKTIIELKTTIGEYEKYGEPPRRDASCSAPTSSEDPSVTAARIGFRATIIAAVIAALATIAVACWLTAPSSTPSVSSTHQKGGVTAQNINVAGDMIVANPGADGEQAKKRAMVGTLQPQPQVALSPEDNILPKIQFGNGAVIQWDSPFGGTILKFLKGAGIRFMIEGGQLKVSTTIRDQTGNIIAELVKNEWRVSPTRAFDRNYTKDALEVRDEKGEVVLQVRMLADRFQFRGILWGTDGRGLLVADGRRDGRTDVPQDGMFKALDAEHPVDPGTIKPMFKYPSDLHLGELVNPATP